jgi:hypothetical protein
MDMYTNFTFLSTEYKSLYAQYIAHIQFLKELVFFFTYIIFPKVQLYIPGQVL